MSSRPPAAIGAHFAPRASPEGGDLKAFVCRSLAVSPYPTQARVVLHAPREVMAQRIPAAYEFFAHASSAPSTMTKSVCAFCCRILRARSYSGLA